LEGNIQLQRSNTKEVGARQTWADRTSTFLGLNRNVGVLALSIFGLALGEELWQAYMPKYLVGLGASGVLVGVFASCKDLLDGLYQYPGGWVNDRFGRKQALMVFTLTAMAGYVVYMIAPRWSVLFIGLVFVMAWKSGAFPATFAIIGEALPHGKRAIAFSLQSILARLPRVISAPLGGLLIVGFGLTAGIRVALAITLVLAFGVFIIQRLTYRESSLHAVEYSHVPAREVFKRMPASLKQLLFADCLVRIGEGIAAAFIVLYVTDVLGFSVPTFGVLYAIQQSVAIALYMPSGKLADLTGRRPLVALTFVFFALFPLAVSWSGSFAALVAAFVVGGLKEMGEPARKSVIVDLADPAQRGRTVGAYYTIRNLLVVPAGTLGGLLWSHSPQLPLYVACGVALLGVFVFLLNSKGGWRLEMGHA
jgi:MFS family permease